jgi:hypothetical protein
MSKCGGAAYGILRSWTTLIVTPPDDNNKFGGVTTLQDNNKIKIIEI